ncbi:hypothetical protein ACOSQ2_012209 [Xanthoceras sorbifolium]
MAVLSLCENDNKENIPPLSSKQTTLVSAKSPSSSTTITNKRRRVRYPLQDITNLFNSRVDSSSVSRIDCRKRRAEAGVESTCKKTHLVHSSRNFR